MHKRTLLKTLALTLSAAGMASALPVDFFYLGQNYGTMDLTVSNASTVQVSFTSNAVPGAGNFHVTGFAFAFADGVNPAALTVTNPGNAAFTTDNNSLNWKLYSKDNYPTTTNTNLHQNVWDLGVTEGQANTMNPPGITPGTSDIFFLSGFSGLTGDASILSNITLEGIRIQSLDKSINGGSLMLSGTVRPTEPPEAVPEPGTMALLGLGLAGLGIAARRKRK